MMNDEKDMHHHNHHPDHLKDLKNSDLSDQTILEARIYSVPPSESVRNLGPIMLGLRASLLSHIQGVLASRDTRFFRRGPGENICSQEIQKTIFTSLKRYGLFFRM